MQYYNIKYILSEIHINGVHSNLNSVSDKDLFKNIDPGNQNKARLYALRMTKICLPDNNKAFCKNKVPGMTGQQGKWLQLLPVVVAVLWPGPMSELSSYQHHQGCRKSLA